MLNNELKYNFDKLIHSECRESINWLIEYSISIAIVYLNIKKNINHYNIGSNLETIEDIAIDAIAPLFVKATNGKLRIINSLSNWDQDLNSSAKLDYLINKIIWNRVEQTISNVLKEKDPFFSKILDTINTCIRNNEFKKISYLGVRYIVKSDISELGTNIITQDKFNELPINLFFAKQKSLLNGILVYMEHEHYFAAIPLNLLVYRVKNLYAIEFVELSSLVSNQEIQKIDIEEVFKYAKERLDNNILKKYVDQNKINDYESHAIRCAFDDISFDMKNDLMNGGLYSYLNKEMANLSSEYFYKKYHGIMNYLLKSFKTDLIDKMEY